VLARTFNWSDLLLPPPPPEATNRSATNRSDECSSHPPGKFEYASVVVHRSRPWLPTSFNVPVVDIGGDVELEKHGEVERCRAVGVKENGAEEDIEKCVEGCLMLSREGSPKQKLLRLRRIIESLTNYAGACCQDMTSHATTTTTTTTTTHVKMEFEPINPTELLVPLLAFVLVKAGLATALARHQDLPPHLLPSSHGRRPGTSVVEGGGAGGGGGGARHAPSPLTLTSSRESDGSSSIVGVPAARLCGDEEGGKNRPGVQRHCRDPQEDPQHHPRRDGEGPHFFSQLAIMRDFVPTSFSTQQEREDILLAQSTLDMLAGWVLNGALRPTDMASRIDGPTLFM
jgi:hypothetical protein